MATIMNAQKKHNTSLLYESIISTFSSPRRMKPLAPLMKKIEIQIKRKNYFVVIPSTTGNEVKTIILDL